MNRAELTSQIEQRWRGKAQCSSNANGTEVACAHSVLPEVCGWLFLDQEFSFAGLVVEETADEWQLRYSFYRERDTGAANGFRR